VLGLESGFETADALANCKAASTYWANA